jgi:hypothetical protein
MTNKVSITYPTRTYPNYVVRTCPPSTSISYVKVSGDMTYVSQSGNSPRLNGRLMLRQNSLNFLKIIQPPAPYEITRTSFGSCPVLSTYMYSCGLTVDKNYFTVGSDMLPVQEDTTARAAALAFYEEIGSVKLNLSQAFAERQQTIDLVASTVSSLVSGYRDLRKGRNPFNPNGRRLKPLKHGTKAMADRWLEYSYGWVPLVQDVYSAFELQKLEPPTLIVKKSRSKSFTETNHGVPHGSPFDNGISQKTESRSRVDRCTLRAKVTVNSPAASFANQVGLTNPALLAWELLPYSFVVDWFYPVGTWLEMQTALYGVSITDASTTRSSRFYGTASVTTYTKPGITSASVNGRGASRMILVRKNRVTGLISVPTPKLKNPLSVSHALSALALFRQVFK